MGHGSNLQQRDGVAISTAVDPALWVPRLPSASKASEMMGAGARPHTVESLATSEGAEETPFLVVAPDCRKASTLGGHIDGGWAGVGWEVNKIKTKLHFFPQNNKFYPAYPPPHSISVPEP